MSDQCPICSGKPWEGSHSVVIWAYCVPELGASAVGGEIRAASHAVAELFFVCRKQSRYPADATLHDAYEIWTSEQEDEQGGVSASELTGVVIAQMKLWPTIAVVEGEHADELFTRDMEEVRERLLQWCAKIGADACRDD
jgi:hypothetical protein